MATWAGEPEALCPSCRPAHSSYRPQRPAPEPSTPAPLAHPFTLLPARTRRSRVPGRGGDRQKRVLWLSAKSWFQPDKPCCAAVTRLLSDQARASAKCPCRYSASPLANCRMPNEISRYSAAPAISASFAAAASSAPSAGTNSASRAICPAWVGPSGWTNWSSALRQCRR